MILRNRQTSRGRESGLTLIEILISMIILSVITTFLVIGWINMQRGAAFAITSNNSRATARDAISKVSAELRGAQPTVLPSPSLSATAMPASQPPILAVTNYSPTPWSIRFYSAFNNVAATPDPSGVGALRLTWIYVDFSAGTTKGVLYLKRDLDNDGSTDGAGDLKVVLAKNVINKSLYDPLSANPTEQVKYALFQYGYRTAPGALVLWTDNKDGTLSPATIVAVRARVIIDANIVHTPKFIDTTTTVRLRNASGS